MMGMRVKKQDLQPSVGQVKGRKVARSTLWTKHEVDQSAGRVGRRYGTRDAGSTPQYGMANGYDHLSMIDFLSGADINMQPEGGVRIGDALTGKTIGYANFADAMAYKIAAMRKGVLLEVYNDVS